MICFQALSSQVAVNSMRQRHSLPFNHKVYQYSCNEEKLEDVNGWLHLEDHLMPI